MPEIDPAPGAAPEEETPQEEVVEESGEMSAEQVEMYEKLGIEVKPKESPEEPAVEEVVEEAEEEVVEEQATPPIEAKEHEPPPDSPRFKKVIWEREEEKRKNATLLAEIETLKASAPPQEQADPEAPTVNVDELNVQLKELKKEWRQAKVDFDTEKEFELEDKVDVLKTQILREELKRPAIDEEAVSKMVKSQALKASWETASRDFASKNPWFKQLTDDGKPSTTYNHAKSFRAVEIHGELAPTWDSTPHTLFAEITRKIDEEFPPAQPKSKVPGVAGVNSVRNIKSSKAGVKLSPADSRMLEGFFGDDEAAKNRVIELAQKQGAN